MRLALLLLLLLLPASPASVQAGGFLGDQERGWFWYEQPPPAEEQAADIYATPAPATFTPPATLAEAQKLLEESKNRAVWNPTPENVAYYQRAQWWMNDKAEAFTEAWKRSLLMNPELDYSLVNPSNASAIAVQKEQDWAQKRVLVAKTAKQYGLYFFFRSTCPFCHKQAPIVKGFEARYGVKVVAVSLDRAGVPDYPNPLPDNGIATALKVDRVPAIFLLDAASKRVLPISNGLISEEEIVRRIGLMTKENP